VGLWRWSFPSDIAISTKVKLITFIQPIIPLYPASCEISAERLLIEWHCEADKDESIEITEARTEKALVLQPFHTLITIIIITRRPIRSANGRKRLKNTEGRKSRCFNVRFTFHTERLAVCGEKHNREQPERDEENESECYWQMNG